jgi:hypothetical protein
MVVSRVLILYEPRLYSDLIYDLIEQLGLVDIVEVKESRGISKSNLSGDCNDVDVVILPLDGNGEPKISLLPDQLPDAKLVAFSPDGTRGLRRMPGDKNWVELRPFGLLQLIVEVLRANPDY